MSAMLPFGHWTRCRLPASASARLCRPAGARRRLPAAGFTPRKHSKLSENQQGAIIPPCQVRQRRPLGDLNTAMRDLDASADEVRALLDHGQLIGFNIGVRARNRTTLRVLTSSLDHFWATGTPLPLAWPDIFRLISPRGSRFLPGVEIQRCLNCDEGHVAAMIRAGHLEPVKHSRQGRNGSPIVTRGSVESFLKKRKL